MPTRKIADLPSVCRHRQHDPPSMLVYEDGAYEHECPGCGHIQRFVVRKPTWGSRKDEERCPVPRRLRSDWSKCGTMPLSRSGSLDARLR
jgi:hypothetical protein